MMPEFPDMLVGQPIPSPPFPSTILDLNTLTFQSLNTLDILYRDNNNFGIVEAEGLPNAITKFQAFICGR